jgi:hypothetical protein
MHYIYSEVILDVSAELRELIEQAHAVVRQGDLPRHREVPPADQPDVRDGLVWGAAGARRDDGRAPAGHTGDAVDARGVEGFGQGHIRQNRGQSPCQPRVPRPGRSQEEHIMVRTPALVSASSESRRTPLATVMQRKIPAF